MLLFGLDAAPTSRRDLVGLVLQGWFNKHEALTVTLHHQLRHVDHLVV